MDTVVLENTGNIRPVAVTPVVSITTEFYSTNIIPGISVKRVWDNSTWTEINSTAQKSTSTNSGLWSVRKPEKNTKPTRKKYTLFIKRPQLLMSPKPDFSKYSEREDFPTNQWSSKPNFSVKLPREESRLLEEPAFWSLDSI